MIKISDAELDVMKVICSKKEVTSLEIIQELEKHNWNDNTIRTLINRLIAKKAVGIARKEGKTYTYIPLVKENEYRTKRTRNFIEQFYHGSIDEMILNFVSTKDISKKDLKKIMDQIDKK